MPLTTEELMRMAQLLEANAALEADKRLLIERICELEAKISYLEEENE